MIPTINGIVYHTLFCTSDKQYTYYYTNKIIFIPRIFAKILYLAYYIFLQYHCFLTQRVLSLKSPFKFVNPKATSFRSAAHEPTESMGPLLVAYKLCQVAAKIYDIWKRYTTYWVGATSVCTLYDCLTSSSEFLLLFITNFLAYNFILSSCIFCGCFQYSL